MASNWLFILLLVNIGLLFPGEAEVKTSYHLTAADAVDRPRAQAFAETEAADGARQVACRRLRLQRRN